MEKTGYGNREGNGIVYDMDRKGVWTLTEILPLLVL